MYQFAKIPTEYVYRALGIEIGRGSALMYKYRSGSDELVNIREMEAGTALDWTRPLEACDRKRISRLYFHKSYCTTLKPAAIKTYLLSFFYLTDLKEGAAEKVSVQKLAEQIGCTERTAWASLDTLQKLGYLSFRKLNPRFVSIQISNYLDMYKKAAEGGKGYIVLSKEACISLLKIRTINDFRIAMKALFSSLQNELYSPSKTAASVLSFADLKDSLPEYIKPCHIRKAFSHIGALIGSVQEGYKDYTVILDKSYSGRQIQSEYRKNARIKLAENVREINLIINKVNSDLSDTFSQSQEILSLLDQYDIHLRTFRFHFGKEEAERFKLSPLELNSAALDSLAHLSSLFSLELVQKAIGLYYEEYINNKVKVESPVGLITAILKDQLNLSKAA